MGFVKDIYEKGKKYYQNSGIARKTSKKIEQIKEKGSFPENIEPTNKVLIGATHHPKKERSDGKIERNLYKLLRKSVGEILIAGNMTEDQQNEYYKYSINTFGDPESDKKQKTNYNPLKFLKNKLNHGPKPKNLTLKNASVIGPPVYGISYAGSYLLGAEGSGADELGTLLYLGFAHGPRTYKALVHGRGSHPMTALSGIQNLKTHYKNLKQYTKKAISYLSSGETRENMRNTLSSQGLIPEPKSLEDKLESYESLPQANSKEMRPKQEAGYIPARA